MEGGTRLHLAVLLLVTIAVFGNALFGGYDYAFDDVHLIVSNKRLDTLQGAVEGFVGDYYTTSERAPSGEYRALGYYRPIPIFLNGLDAQLWGRRPFGFHLTNVLFHLGVVLSFYFLAARLLRHRPAALGVSLLFAVHPAHTESVTFISGRVDVVAAFFYVLSLLWFVRAWDSENRERRTALSLLFFFLALLSKEMAVTLPVAVFLVAILFPHSPFRGWRAALRRTLPYLGVIGVYAVVRLLVIGSMVSRSGGVQGNLAEVWRRSVTVLFEYTELLVWPPFRFNVEPPVAVPEATNAALVLKAGLLIALVILGVVAARRGAAAIALGIFWTAVALVPVAQIVPVETLVGERFLYIPTLGACILIASSFRSALLRSAEPPRVRRLLWAALLGLIVIAYGANTIKRNAFWKDNFTFWLAKTRLSVGSAEAHTALAIEYALRGQKAEAFSEYQTALTYDPRHFEALHNVALLLLEAGRAGEALKAATQACQLNAKDPVARNTLGNCLYSLGQFGEAIPQYKRAVQFRPDYREAWVNLGNTYLTAGVPEEAQYAYRMAAEIEGDEALYLKIARCYALLGNLDGGIAYLAQVGVVVPGSARALIVRGTLAAETGRSEEAIRSLQEATALSPESVESWHELGLALATSGRHEEARQAFERALAINPGLSVIHNSLGALADEMGRKDEALAHFERAAVLAPDDPEVLRNLGAALVETGRYADGLQALEQALIRFPNDPLAYYYRGLAHDKTGKPQEALQDYQSAITLNPAFAEAHLRMGEIYTAMGKSAEARSAFQKYLRWAPPDDPQRKSIEAWW